MISTRSTAGAARDRLVCAFPIHSAPWLGLATHWIALQPDDETLSYLIEEGARDGFLTPEHDVWKVVHEKDAPRHLARAAGCIARGRFISALSTLKKHQDKTCASTVARKACLELEASMGEITRMAGLLQKKLDRNPEAKQFSDLDLGLSDSFGRLRESIMSLEGTMASLALDWRASAIADHLVHLASIAERYNDDCATALYDRQRSIDLRFLSARGS